MAQPTRTLRFLVKIWGFSFDFEGKGGIFGVFLGAFRVLGVGRGVLGGLGVDFGDFRGRDSYIRGTFLTLFWGPVDPGG